MVVEDRSPSNGDASEETVSGQLLAQRSAIDAEHGSGAALIPVVKCKHFAQQRTFDFANDERVQTFIARRVTDIRKVTPHSTAYAFTQCAL
jgi:hypothetical protein